MMAMETLLSSYNNILISNKWILFRQSMRILRSMIWTKMANHANFLWKTVWLMYNLTWKVRWFKGYRWKKWNIWIRILLFRLGILKLMWNWEISPAKTQTYSTHWIEKSIITSCHLWEIIFVNKTLLLKELMMMMMILIIIIIIINWTDPK